METFTSTHLITDNCIEKIDILSFILKTESNFPKVVPSIFMAEMSLTTEERLHKLKENSKNSKNVIKTVSETFEIIPAVIIFQNFDAQASYMATLTLKNKQFITKPLRALYNASPNFCVSYGTQASCLSIAPGLSVQFNIKFKAEDIKDYKYKITFQTEGETFVVPIIAIGPRPLLNLPDCITIPKSLVKSESKSTTLVRNLGRVTAIFTTYVTPPFNVNIEKGVLLPNQDMQLIVHFNPSRVGLIEGTLTICFENGEQLLIQLLSTSETSNVSLEKGAIKFDKTFIGLTRQRIITLFNNDKRRVTFEWKMYPNSKMDDERIQKFKKDLEFIKINEILKSNQLQTYNIIEGKSHALVYDRIFQDEIEELSRKNQFQYQHSNFQIIPSKGEIWPESQLDLTVIFSPNLVQMYNTSAYLEITGQEDRKRLNIFGEAVGPTIILNTDSLNVNTLYMCSIHEYEIAAFNKGDIPGKISFIPAELDFGGTLSCSPDFLYLYPNETGAFILKFSSKQEGRFYEEIQFEIEMSKEVIRFILMGRVVTPVLETSLSKIDFGMIPIGYPIQQDLKLINSSAVPIEYKLWVPLDGSQPAITCEEVENFRGTYYLENDIQEFQIIPSEGTVPNNSSQVVQVFLTANIGRKWSCILNLKMWDSDKHIIVIPVKYHALSPQIKCTPNQMNIRFCFLRYPYQRTIVIKNESCIPGYFQIINDSPSKEGGITYTSAIKGGHLKPYEMFEVDLTVVTTLLGEDVLTFFIQFFGEPPTLCCTIKCRGQGAVVTTENDYTDFGKVKCLESAYKELIITNESPIVAYVTTNISSKSLFKVEPKHLELLPEESTKIYISLYITDPNKVSDKFQINVEEGTDLVHVVKAKGIGTSILCKPKIDPILFLGYILTNKSFMMTIELTNMSKRFHKILWSHNDDLKQMKDVRCKYDRYIFDISPKEFELASLQSMQCILNGSSSNIGTIQENLYCYAHVDKEKAQKIIINCEVCAEFVEPILKYSKTELRFRKDVSPHYFFEFLTDTITVTNVTPLPIEVNVYLEHPFYLILDKDLNVTNFTFMKLKTEESLDLTIKFQVTYGEKRLYSKQGTLTFDFVEHPKIDELKVFGEVNYPNLELNYKNIDFLCLPKNTYNFCEIFIKNISPLSSTYHFEWPEGMYEATEICSFTTLADRKFSKHSLVSKTSSESELNMEDNELLKINCENVNKGMQDLKVIDKEYVQTGQTVFQKEYVYFNICIEERLSYHYTQIKDILQPSIKLKDVIFYSQRNKDYAKDIHKFLCGPLTSFYKQKNNTEALRSLTIEEIYDKHYINCLIKAMPARGFLKPYECQLLTVCFRPLPDIEFNAQLTCEIEGAATERLEIDGKSSVISFEINNLEINFGFQIFCLMCQKSFTITNTGIAEFKFVISADEFTESLSTSLMLEVGTITVFPKHGLVLPNETVEIKVFYLPGISGEFNEKFSVQVGYLPATFVSVSGYGVFPQVFLNLLRPSFTTLNSFTTYFAISTLTPDYLNYLKNMIFSYKDTDIYEDISKADQRKLRNNGWKIISYNDVYPTVIDINMAIERIILFENILNNPEALSEHLKPHKSTIIPNFVTPHYLVDLEYVILETTAYYTIVIQNYGPANTSVKLAPISKNNSVNKVGFSLEFTKCSLDVGDTIEMYLSFYPTSEVYTELDAHVTHVYNLDVAHGARIPILVKAIVTVPRITPSVDVLDFGTVRCGDCKKMSFILHNEGYVESEYYVTIEQPKRKYRIITDEYCETNKRVIFYVKNCTGVLSCGSSCLLDVYFEPFYKADISTSLIITINQNSHPVIVTLMGQAATPDIKIQDEIVEFSPALPYVEKCEKSLTIENISAFPIEIFLSDFDLEIEEEEKIIDLLCRFYNCNQLYIPYREAGQKLPSVLLDFYNKFNEALWEKLSKMNQIECFPNSSGGSTVELQNKNENNKLLGCFVRKSNIYLDKLNPFVTKTPKELELLTQECIEELRCIYKNPNNLSDNVDLVDPISKSFSESRRRYIKNDVIELKQGVFIIFHGGPFTNTSCAANKAALETELPVYNIDMLIFEVLITNNTYASIKVNEIINQEFKVFSQNIDFPSNEDKLEEIKTKIDVLLKNSSIEGRKGSGKKEKTKKDQNTFLNIPEEILFDIIRYRLSLLKTGIVIESLTSIFLKTPVTAFNVLLKAIGNVRYILFVILSYTLEDYLEHSKILKQKKLKEKKIKRTALINRINEMDSNEYMTLSQKDFDIYKKYYLKDRMTKSLEKQDTLRKRLYDKNFSSKHNKQEIKELKKKDEKPVKSPATSRGGSKSSKLNKDLKSRGESDDSDSSTESKRDDATEDASKRLLFVNYENDIRYILHTLEYWDRKSGTNLKPYVPVKGSPKKSPKSPKSPKSSGKSAKKQNIPVTILPPIVYKPPFNEIEERKFIQSGIPYWIIINAHPEKSIEGLISSWLCSTEELKKSRILLQESLEIKLREEIEVYSILNRRSKERMKNISDLFFLRDDEQFLKFSIENASNFQLMDKEIETDSKINLSKTFKTKNQKEKRKTSLKSGKKTLTSVSDTKETSLDVDDRLTKRIALHSGEMVTYVIHFKPTMCGTFTHTFTLETSGWPEKYHITCVGIVDIPRLNMAPESIFRKVIKEKSQKYRFSNDVFIKSSNTFSFGPVLHENIRDLEMLSINAEFKFTNISQMLCEPTFSLKKDNGVYKCLPYYPLPLFIEPKMTKSLSLRSLPTKEEDTDDRLIISIKNNPKIETVYLSNEICFFKFIVAPKQLSFIRVPLDAIETKTLLLKNDSLVSTNWCFEQPENFLKHFRISLLKGSLLPKEEVEIVFEFSSNSSINVKKQLLKILIFYGECSCGPPIYSESVEIISEAIEIKLNYVKEINVGDIRGRFENKIIYSFVNDGYYSVKFEISEVLPNQDPHFKKNKLARSYFVMSEMNGILPSGKETELEIEFFAKKFINLKKLPIFNCKLKDPVSLILIDYFIITVTGNVTFSNYEFCPNDFLKFDSQKLNTQKIQTIILKNLGKFCFRYEIFSSQVEMKTIPSLTKKEVKEKDSKQISKKSDKSVQMKSMKIAFIRVGIFTITPSVGIVEPNNFVNIEVSSSPTTLETVSENILFFISECVPEHKNGVPYVLNVTGCLPNINLTNLDFIFREQYIVDCFDNFEYPPEAGPLSVFVVNEKQLRFCRVALNTTQKAKLRLQNISSVTASVLLSISQNSVFSVSPLQLTIEPYLTEYAIVSFTPNYIELSKALLTINNTEGGNKLEIMLLGESLVPEVELISPIFNSEEQRYIIHFNPTLVGKESYQNISLKNVGLISCQVIIEICEKQSDCFLLCPNEKTKSVLAVTETVIENTASTNLINLKVSETVALNLQFLTHKVEETTCTIKLHVINNPFEIYKIFVTAKSYYQDVTIDGLPTCTVAQINLRSHIQFKNPFYNLNFGLCSVKSLQKKCFKIINNSTKESYKFEFINIDRVFFTPTIGHLKPNNVKDIIVTFFSKEPVNICDNIIECLVYKIEYINAEDGLISWDDRQHIVTWELLSTKVTDNTKCSISSFSSNGTEKRVLDNEENNSSDKKALKTVIEKPEPEIELLTKNADIVSLAYNVVCNYSSYECNEHQIEFSNVTLYETRSYYFNVSNTSNVFLNLQWYFEEQNCLKSESIQVNSDDKLVCKKEFLEILHVITENHGCKKADTNDLVHLSGFEKFINKENKSPTSSTSSCEVDINNLNSLDQLTLEDTAFAFSITPTSIVISPNCSQTFTVTFTPRQTSTYSTRLYSNIINLNPYFNEIDIIIKANSILPICIFDLGSNNYIPKRKETTHYCKDILDPHTKIIEFEAIGLQTDNLKKFTVLNPTNNCFIYKWTPIPLDEEIDAYFYCHITDGIIGGYKKAEAIFSFIPQNVGIFESLYLFEIDKLNFKQTFLLRGSAREAHVYFSIPSLNIRPTVLGVDITEQVSIKNNENINLKFKFKKDSLYSEAYQQVLNVEPMNGILLAQQEQQLKINFHAIQTGPVFFQLKCCVERMKKCLLLPINANCYNLKCNLSYISEEGTNVLCKPDIVNNMEIKALVPFLKREITFNIENLGIVGFYYMWDIKEDKTNDNLKLCFYEKQGYIKSNEKISSVLSITPLRKISFKQLIIKLEIRYGPTYIFHLEGQTLRALFSFSFNKYDFGLCLIQKEATSYYTQSLEFTNHDDKPMMLEHKSVDQDFLSINFKSKQIEPKKTENILISFHPLEKKKYFQSIQFFVNSNIYLIKICGEGVPANIKLINKYEKFINVGAIPVGSTSTKIIKVVNEGVTPVDILFELHDRLPYFNQQLKRLQPDFDVSEKQQSIATTVEKSSKENNKKGKEEKIKADVKTDKNKTDNKKSDADKKSKNDKKGKERKSLEKSDQKSDHEFLKMLELKNHQLRYQFISVEPKKFTRCLPHHSIEVAITFTPKERLQKFTENVFFQIQDCIDNLCTFKGCFTNSEYTLDKKSLSFGGVVIGYSSTKKFCLHNTGDIGGRFKWYCDVPECSFTVVPHEGHLAPNTSVAFSVTFIPTQVTCLIHAEFQCRIEKFEPILHIDFDGSGLGLPSPTETIHFSCNVREEVLQYITVNNGTGERWKLSPIIDGPYFFGRDTLVIEPRSHTNYEILYKPLTMTLNTYHSASIFFNIPEGNGLLYKLIGISLRPKPVDTIYREINCKTYHTECLNIKNWLSIPQRFTVKSELVGIHYNHGKTLYKIIGNENIEVLAQDERVYQWKIYAINEGILNFQVEFINSETKEFLYYEIKLTILKYVPLDAIELETCIRSPILHQIKLQNPISVPVTFSPICSSSELKCLESITVLPYSENILEVTYQPVTIGQNNASININTHELGTYLYNFILKGNSPFPEPALSFSTNLGQIATQKVIMKNTCSSKIDFTAQIDYPHIFYLEKSVSAAPYQNVEFKVNFEPDSIGNIRSRLTLFSPLTGPYIYPLVAVCDLPKPQGPFFVKPGGSTIITFKNPFREAFIFDFNVEPAIFESKVLFEEIKSKQEIKIFINLVPVQNLEILIKQKYPITGKLVVTSRESTLSHIKWIYYLQGNLVY